MKKKLVSILLLLMIICTISNCAYGVELIEKNEENELYKYWKELPDSEKAKLIEPLSYSIPYVEKETEEMPDSFIIGTTVGTQNPESYAINGLKIKHQGSTPECWAFVTTTILESSIAKRTGTTPIELSPRHIDYATSDSFVGDENPYSNNRRVSKDYGSYFVSMPYCLSGRGPVAESSMPFKDFTDEEKIMYSDIEGLKVETKINQYRIFPSLYKTYSGDSITYTDGASKVYTEEQVKKMRDEIKYHLMNYGAIGTYTYLGSNSMQFFNTEQAQQRTQAWSYYCNQKLSPDHGVTIIGWDDNYSRENFNENCRPSKDGAYIIQNSYGTNAMNGGYYFISYEDYLVENVLVGVVETEDVNYDRIYQHDMLGYSKELYLNTSSVIFGNVYTSENKDTTKDEIISEIGYMSFGKCNVKLYILPDYNNSNSLVEVGSVANTDTGYFSYKLNNPVTITGEKFAVYLEYSTDDDYVVIPVEYNFNTTDNNGHKYWNKAVAARGEGYFIDSTGEEDLLDVVEDGHACNFIIKAFTNTVAKGSNTPRPTTPATNTPATAVPTNGTQTAVPQRTNEQIQTNPADNTLANRILPNTGVGIGLIVVLGIVVINTIIVARKYRNMKDIK